MLPPSARISPSPSVRNWRRKPGRKLGSSQAQVFMSHQRPYPVAPLQRRAETDRAAPVVHHQRDLAQVERVDQRDRVGHVVGEHVAARLGRLVGAAEAHVVEGHAAMPASAQQLDRTAVHVAPGWIAVEHQKWGSVARPLVHVVKPDVSGLGESGLVGKRPAKAPGQLRRHPAPGYTRSGTLPGRACPRRRRHQAVHGFTAGGSWPRALLRTGSRSCSRSPAATSSRSTTAAARRASTSWTCATSRPRRSPPRAGRRPRANRGCAPSRPGPG